MEECDFLPEIIKNNDRVKSEVLKGSMAVNTNDIQDSISTKELYREYSWYKDSFSSLLQEASDNFFTENFRIEFIGLSKNINCLLNNEPCFVTKIKIDDEHDMFFRLTEKTIDIILEKVLGKSKSKFNINKISELEAKIITAFNSFMFDSLKPKMNEPDKTLLKRTNFDMIHLTFILKDIVPENKSAGKIIVTLPLALLSPEKVESKGNTFANTDFPESEIFAKVIMGKMRFPLFDIKSLEQGDVVVFENSDIHKMTLSIQDELIEINLNPNMDLLIPQEDDTEGENMAARNIWDSIEVEMNAEFDSVKITLAELKNIEDGLVVDLTSLYDNNVTLKVEGKPIASGSLVIVNDRYGVKINNVIAKGTPTEVAGEESTTEENDQSFAENDNYEEETDSSQASSDEGEDEEEDFDYSDFDLDYDNL